MAMLLPSDRLGSKKLIRAMSWLYPRLAALRWLGSNPAFHRLLRKGSMEEEVGGCFKLLLERSTIGGKSKA